MRLAGHTGRSRAAIEAAFDSSVERSIPSRLHQSQPVATGAPSTTAAQGDHGKDLTEPTDAVFTQISVGDEFSCGLTADGSLVCWGGHAWIRGSPPQGKRGPQARVSPVLGCGQAAAGSRWLRGFMPGQPRASSGTFA